MRATVLCMTLAVAAACQPVDRKRQASNVADTTAPVDTTRVVPPPPPPAAPGATRMLTVAGFSTPESVLHDSTQDIYFVSNINGSPTAKDNNGFISRVRPDGAIENLKFIEGGRAGVTLNAPKGLAVLGDTLWVTDIDRIRAFNARTGTPLDSIRLDSAGAGGFDGVAVVGTRILVSSWTDSTVSAYETGQEVKVITGVPSPADIGYDAKRNRVLIPILTGNRVEIWQLQ